MRVVVVGGGLLGMMTARELSKSGASVTLLEQGSIGQESSWAGGGILSPLYPWNYADSVNALAKWSQQYYPQLIAELIEEGGIDPEWTQSGLLVLDTDTFPRAKVWAEAYGMSCEQLDSRALHERESELATKYEQGLLFPEVAQVRNPRLTKCMQASCQKRGIQLVEQCQVNGLLISGSTVTGVTTTARQYEADVGFDKSTTNEALLELRHAAEELFPCLGEAEIEHHWSGLRPESPAGIPYICNVPGTDGLFLNAGHFRNGVVLAPASVRLVSDLILGQKPILNPADYGCERA